MLIVVMYSSSLQHLTPTPHQSSVTGAGGKSNVELSRGEDLCGVIVVVEEARKRSGRAVDKDRKVRLPKQSRSEFCGSCWCSQSSGVRLSREASLSDVVARVGRWFRRGCFALSSFGGSSRDCIG
jgi:hypothetical protein